MFKLIAAIFWLASLAFVYQLGLAQFKPNMLLSHNLNENQPAPIAQESVVLSQTERGDSADSKSEQVANELNVEQVIDELLRIDLAGGPFSVSADEMLSFYTHLASLDESGLAEAFKKVASNENGRNTPYLLSLILGEFARLSPERAMEFVVFDVADERHLAFAQASIASIWAQSDAESALQWYLTSHEIGNEGHADKTKVDDYVVRAIFKELAKNDLSYALSQIVRVPNEDNVLWSVSRGIMLSVDENTDMRYVIDELSRYNSPDMVREVLNGWSNTQPEQVANWLDEQKPSKARHQQKLSLLRTWMRNNSDDAANWYIKDKEEGERNNAINHVMRHWAYNSPSNALSWIEKQENIDSNFAINSLLQNTAGANPAFTVANLDRLEESNSKMQLMANLVVNYYKKDKDATRSFIESSSHREYLEQHLAAYIAEQAF